MLGLSELKQTRVYQEARDEGKQEGQKEGREEVLRVAILALVDAERLQTDQATIERVLRAHRHLKLLQKFQPKTPTTVKLRGF